jgi:hypothetical protein
MPVKSTRRPARGAASARTAKSAADSDIERELRAWIKQYGRRGEMPSRGQLMRSGHGHLASRIHHRGGSGAFARRLGLRAQGGAARR